MLESLGIAPDAFGAAVAEARSDEDVASFVKAHAVPGGANAWNGFVLARELYDGDRAEALEDLETLKRR